jgi:putative ABC transport system ATP-binding protein
MTVNMTTHRSALTLERASKRYGNGQHAVSALSDVSLSIPEGQFVSVIGRSGSGKTTLLNLAAAFDTPTSGRVLIDDRDIAMLSEDERSALRLYHIGFVFQSFNLFPTFTAEENVAWRLEFQGVGWRKARTIAADALDEVGIRGPTHDRLPAQLSGGEQQRVAIARALVTGPHLLLADEPTGNLDSRTGQTILELLQQLNVERGLTILMVTHSTHAATCGHRTVELSDGQVIHDARTPPAANGRFATPISLRD